MENPLPILHEGGISIAFCSEIILYKVRYTFPRKPLTD